MARVGARDFPPGVMSLFDHGVRGRRDRRGLLEAASRHAGGGMTALAMLAALNPDFAMARLIEPDEVRLGARVVEFDSPTGNGQARGQLARPKGATGKLPAVLVVHAKCSLNPHIEDVTRRLALENFVAFAADALFPLGGYRGNEDKAREVVSYPGTLHGFHDDTTPRYDEAAAKLAWPRTLAFFNRHLRG